MLADQGSCGCETPRSFPDYVISTAEPVRGLDAPRPAGVRTAARQAPGDERSGADIVRRALESPMRQIAINAGVDGSIVVQTVRASKDVNFGYNAATDTYEDMIKAGVVDPAKVTCAALQNAASVATLLLTTEALISTVPEKKKAPAGGHDHGHDHGGMGDMDF